MVRGRKAPFLCLAGDRVNGIIDKVRWWRDKTISTRTGHYSKFMVVPPAMATAARPELEAVCMRTHLETYYMRTQHVLRDDNKFFVSTKKMPRSLKFKGIAATTVATDVVGLMAKAGVPDRFRGHSLKAASAAAIRGLGGSEADVLNRCHLSGKVYREFYEKPILVFGVEDTELLHAGVPGVTPRLLTNCGSRGRARGRVRRGGRSRAAGSRARAPVEPPPPPPAPQVTDQVPAKPVCAPAIVRERSDSSSEEYAFGDSRDEVDWPVERLCDARDQFGRWFSAKVVAVRSDNGPEVKVHFHRFNKRWDRWISVGSGDIAERGALTKGRARKRGATV